MVAATALGCPAEMQLQRVKYASSPSISGTQLTMPGAPTARRMRKQAVVAARGRSINAVATQPFLNGAKHLEEWAPDSWKRFEALQQPNYPDRVRHGYIMKVCCIATPQSTVRTL